MSNHQTRSAEAKGHRTSDSVSEGAENERVNAEAGEHNNSPAEPFEQLRLASKLLLTGYKTKFAYLANTASLEWQLSLKSLLIIFMLVLGLTAFVVTGWLVIVASIAFAMHDLGVASWMIVTAILAGHVALSFWFWSSIKRFLKHIGFSQTIQSALN